MSWNTRRGKRSRERVLLNKSSTKIRFSPKSNPDYASLFKKLEEKGVPLSYANDLNEIYFTRLNNAGDYDYSLSRIRISVDQRSWIIVEKVFVHELAHHIDRLNQSTDSDELIKEKKTCSHYMPDGYARKDVYEYFACGFEVYYFGSVKEKKRMKEMNPKLYSMIERLHKKYARM